MANDTITYPLKRQRDAIWNKFLTDFENKRNCDVIFKFIGDNIEIHAHKLILERASEYFTSLFNSESNNEDNSNEYEITTVEGSIYLTIMQSIYGNEITVNSNNCVQLLRASYVMKLEEIQDICKKFMIQNMTVQNCLEYLTISGIYSNCILIEASVEIIYRNFAQVVKSKEFLTLQSNALELLLRGSGLICPSEKSVFQAFQKWITFNLNKRKRFIEPLIVYIKLPFIEIDYFWKTVAPWIEEHVKDKTITNTVAKWHATQEIDSKFKHMTLERNPQYHCPAKFSHVFVYIANDTGEKVICRVSMDEQSKSSISINKVVYYFGQSVKIIEKEFDKGNSRRRKICKISYFNSNSKLCYCKSNIYGFHYEGRILKVKKYNIGMNKFSFLPCSENLVGGSIYGAFAFNDNIYLVVIFKSTYFLQRYDTCKYTLEVIENIQWVSGECSLQVSADGTVHVIAKDGTSESFDLSDSKLTLQNVENSDEESIGQEYSFSDSSDEESLESTDDESSQCDSSEKDCFKGTVDGSSQSDSSGEDCFEGTDDESSQSDSSDEHIYERRLNPYVCYLCLRVK